MIDCFKTYKMIFIRIYSNFSSKIKILKCEKTIVKQSITFFNILNFKSIYKRVFYFETLITGFHVKENDLNSIKIIYDVVV